MTLGPESGKERVGRAMRRWLCYMHWVLGGRPGRAVMATGRAARIPKEDVERARVLAQERGWKEKCP
jgi:hypothetical protein